MIHLENETFMYLASNQYKIVYKTTIFLPKTVEKQIKIFDLSFLLIFGERVFIDDP